MRPDDTKQIRKLTPLHNSADSIHLGALLFSSYHMQISIKWIIAKKENHAQWNKKKKLKLKIDRRINWYYENIYLHEQDELKWIINITGEMGSALHIIESNSGEDTKPG